MPPVETRSEYSMDRTEAAAFLGVSTRTLDRYVRLGKVSSKKIGYHVLLSQNDVEDLKRELGERVDDVSVVIEEKRERRASQEKTEPKEEGITTAQDLENEVYRVLFERTQHVLEKKQKEVEMLNFRLGQMEVELKSRVPLLEYQGNVDKLSEENRSLQDKLLREAASKEEYERTVLIQKLLKSAYLGLFLLTVVAFVIMLAVR